MARGGLSFSDGFTSRRAGSMSGGAAAAGNASVAETFGALEGDQTRCGRNGRNGS